VLLIAVKKLRPLFWHNGGLLVTNPFPYFALLHFPLPHFQRPETDRRYSGVGITNTLL